MIARSTSGSMPKGSQDFAHHFSVLPGDGQEDREPGVFAELSDDG